MATASTQKSWSSWVVYFEHKEILSEITPPKKNVFDVTRHMGETTIHEISIVQCHNFLYMKWLSIFLGFNPCVCALPKTPNQFSTSHFGDFLRKCSKLKTSVNGLETLQQLAYSVTCTIFFLLVCIIAGTYIDLMLQKVNFKNW